MADQYYDVYDKSQYNGVSNGTTAETKNIVGLVGFILSLISFAFCGVLSLIALILSIIGIKKANDLHGDGKGISIAGTILSAVSIISGIIMKLLFLTPIILNEVIDENDTWTSVDNTVINYNYGDY